MGFPKTDALRRIVVAAWADDKSVNLRKLSFALSLFKRLNSLAFACGWIQCGTPRIHTALHAGPEGALVFPLRSDRWISLQGKGNHPPATAWNNTLRLNINASHCLSVDADCQTDALQKPGEIGFTHCMSVFRADAVPPRRCPIILNSLTLWRWQTWSTSLVFPVE